MGKLFRGRGEEEAGGSRRNVVTAAHPCAALPGHGTTAVWSRRLLCGHDTRHAPHGRQTTPEKHSTNCAEMVALVRRLRRMFASGRLCTAGVPT